MLEPTKQPINNEDLPQDLVMLQWIHQSQVLNGKPKLELQNIRQHIDMLQNIKKYVVPNSVFIGDGSPLKINAVGDI